MGLEKAQEDEIRKKVVEKFGEECVKQMDIFYMELNDIRMSATDSFDYLEKVKAHYGNENTNLLLAGLLYGMKLGEIGYEYHLKQLAEAQGLPPPPSRADGGAIPEPKPKKDEPPLDEESEKLRLKKWKADDEEHQKALQREREAEAKEEERKAFAFERDYQ